MKNTLLVILTLTLSSCASTVPEVTTAEEYDFCGIKEQSSHAQAKLSSWNDDLLEHGLDFALEKHGYPIGQTEKYNEDDIGVGDGACGESFVGFYKVLDSSNDAGFDEFYEINEDGNTINKWVYPYNWYILALDGDSIIVPYSVSTICAYGGTRPRYGSAIKISLSGEISLLEKEEYPEYETVDCPENKLFKNSAYKGCALYTDIAHPENPKRLFMMQWPCT